MKKNAVSKQQVNYFTWKNYFYSHSMAFKVSIAQLIKTPLASFMLIAVIGISLALPTFFWVGLNNVQKITSNWQQGTQISLFLSKSLSQAKIDDLIVDISMRRDVESVNYISPDLGLKKLEQQAGMINVLQQLSANPLPGVIEVFPNPSITDSALIHNLLLSLQNFSGVESSKLDMQWLKRMNAIILLVQRLVLAIMVLLSSVVILVISNTIRLATQNQQQEIKVLSLIGASNGFVRRPFLYKGILYGAAGGLFAWILVLLIKLALQAEVTTLAALYNTSYYFSGLGLVQLCSLLLCGAFLGWIGSWIAVNKHLRT